MPRLTTRRTTRASIAQFATLVKDRAFKMYARACVPESVPEHGRAVSFGKQRRSGLAGWAPATRGECGSKGLHRDSGNIT